MGRRLAVLMALLAVFGLTACTVSTEPPEVEMDYELDQEEQLRDMTFFASHLWNDMGKEKDIEDSRLYTIGKSQTNYIGLVVLYYDDAQFQLEDNMKDTKVEEVRTWDLGDGGYEYFVVSEANNTHYETRQVRIKDGDGIYVISMMGYDLTPAKELWDEFMDKVELD